MTEVFRASGAGNDFLALVEPAAEPGAARIRAWCRRGISLGADGVFAIRRQGKGGPVAMTYWNADGGEAALCVNATRCAAQLAFLVGWAEREVTIATGAGPFAGRRVSADTVELEMEPPRTEAEEVTLGGPELQPALRAFALTVGVPHAVIPWDEDLARLPIARLGPPVRRHPRFPHGANANFVRTTGPHSFDIRTWERGVEAETLACGSGVLATVAVGVQTGTLALPARARTRGGFVLTVNGRVENGRIAHWTMAGDARVLSRGEVLPGAEVELEVPAW